MLFLRNLQSDMASVLSTFLYSWSRCRLPTLCSRSFAVSSMKSNWGDRTEKKCHLKEGNCSGNQGACSFRKFPKCEEPNMKPAMGLKCCSDKNLTTNSCSATKKPHYNDKKHVEFKSMWATGDFVRECPDLVPRLDDTHYHPTNKETRVYTKTWNTCEPIFRNRRVCCFEDLCDQRPPLEKRAKRFVPETAKERDSDEFKANYTLIRSCLPDRRKNSNVSTKRRCVKIVMPCCRKVAKSLKCKIIREPKKCLKECCPYPSFSECDHVELRPQSPQECPCTEIVNQCDINRFIVIKKKFNLPPPLPAWPPERPK